MPPLISIFGEKLGEGMTRYNKKLKKNNSYRGGAWLRGHDSILYGIKLV